MCITVNTVYAKYRTYFIYLVLTTIVPLIIIIGFDLLTYRYLHVYSIQQRRRLLSVITRQMTTMTLFHIAPVIIFQAPFAISQCYFLTVGISKDPVRGAQEQIVQQFFNVLGYGIYATSFYCYYVASKRFRKQVFNVFSLNHQRRNRVRPS
ncbi:unnamed protein product [Rotaria sp. Silwood1]|nr:unnamed protein product [Rotaria sp. Silwood1]CAF1623239.1 unnamed protein product [Rotaria sp. Silwood1]CAF3721695.1 unnamed protein product [Rotaria sp. Silwood1]CAF3739348.1 unnamed protein product [Rotaria sp. Silwood1]CAF3750443.1 unnamed protein product [Rotaria sp. Silwood1]